MLRCIARGIGHGCLYTRPGSMRAAVVSQYTSPVAIPPSSVFACRTPHITVDCPANTGCMKASLRSAAFPALHPQNRLFCYGASMPRCHLGTIQQRRIASNASSSSNGCREEGCCASSSCSQPKQDRHISSTRRSTVTHAAAAAGTWDNSHSNRQQVEEHPEHHQQGHSADHSHPHTHSSNHSSGTHGHFHSHNGHHHHHHHHHHHDHHNGYGHHHHHHFHTDAAVGSSNPVLAILSRSGMFKLADHLERHTAYTVTSVSCFIAAMLMPYAAAQVSM